MRKERIAVGDGAARREIAVLCRDGGTPGLFWLGGFKSDMTGTKAEGLDAFGARSGRAVTRFDYSGHGQSGGDFLDGTVTRWLEEALAVFALTEGAQVVIGSSMGAWLALLVNRALRAQGGSRVKGLVLVAPAVDMTEDLMRSTFSPAELHRLHATGRIERASDYSAKPYLLTESLIVDGARHLMMGKGSITTACPVAILAGGRDTDVPLAHALKLLSHLTLDPVSFTLVPDGDHRLSRPEDIARLEATIETMLAER